MLVLVAYATIEGHTRKIAHRIATKCEAAGHEVMMADLAQPGGAMPGRFDAVILCGPIHAGQYPAPLVSFVQGWRAALEERPAALVTVSLAIASEHADERSEAEAYPRELQRRTGWRADVEYHAAGALKYLEYDFFKRWVMRRIAEKEGGPVDVTQDHVLTNWPALDEFVHGFLERAQTEN